MSIIMKLLAGVVAIAAVFLFFQMNKHTPFGGGKDAFLTLLPGIVILVAVLYALGEILAKLNVVIASLDRPQVYLSKPKTVDPPISNAEQAPR